MSEFLYDQIINTPSPSVVNPNLRHVDSPHRRKVWAAEIRSLFKSLKIKGVSVTTPNYSMAQGVQISLPGTITWISGDDHVALHDKLDREHVNDEVWHGRSTYCPHCQKSQQAQEALKRIILAAFPDLDDRSDYVTDYSDYCFSIHG